MTASEMRQRLSERDRAILLQAYDDLVMPEFVQPRHFRTQTVAAAQSVIRRLCAASVLYSLPLSGRRRYYRLTRHGAQAIQVHARHTRPLKRQGLVNRFALSWFFNVLDLDRSYRFDPANCQEEFPQFANRRYWRRPFYVREDDQTGSARFGVVLVDHGASRRRLASKVTDLLAELIRSGWLDPRHTERHLTLTLLTHTEGRSTSLENILREHIATNLRNAIGEDLVSIECLAVPDLDTLIINTRKK